MDLSTITKQLGRTIDKNSPTILTFLGVAGLIGSVVMAVKATPKAVQMIKDEEEFRLNPDHGGPYEVPLTPVEVVELTWKCYIPTALMMATTAGCMIASNHISMRRNAALISLFSVAESTLREYQTQVVDKIGEKKNEQIEAEVAQKHLNDNPVQDKAVIITGHGDYLCFDQRSGRYFKSTIEHIQRAEISFNQELIREGWLDLNEFYDRLGLDPIAEGDLIGWEAVRGILEIRTSSKQATTGEPCLVIDFRVQPKHI